ncbi:MAG: hypothetical protein HGA47_02785 [Zoogloea sp.]|nr:hypothetical protein [Zoogloea sp.]
MPSKQSGKSERPLPGHESPNPGIPMSPGDEAPAGTPGTGENLCQRCEGSGKVKGEPCPACDGTGYVNVGIGGA